MTKLNFILLYLWSALAFAIAARHPLGRPSAEWFKFGVRGAQQQPVPTDLWHLLLLVDPDRQLLHAAAQLAA